VSIAKRLATLLIIALLTFPTFAFERDDPPTRERIFKRIIVRILRLLPIPNDSGLSEPHP